MTGKLFEKQEDMGKKKLTISSKYDILAGREREEIIQALKDLDSIKRRLHALLTAH